MSERRLDAIVTHLSRLELKAACVPIKVACNATPVVTWSGSIAHLRIIYDDQHKETLLSALNDFGIRTTTDLEWMCD